MTGALPLRSAAARDRSTLAQLYQHRGAIAILIALTAGAMLGSYTERLNRARRNDGLRLGEAQISDNDRALAISSTDAVQSTDREPCPIASPIVCENKAPAAATTDADGDIGSFYSHDPALRPVDPSMADTPVCMLVRTYAAHRNMLMALLASVLLWDHPALTIYLLDTGKDAPFSELPRLASLASKMAGKPDTVRVSKWTHASARAQFPDYKDEDHGYIATDLAIEDILAERETARNIGSPSLPCDYLIVTNGDNLYGHDYLAATLGEIKTGVEMVNTHWVSHYEMNKAWILGWGEIQNGHCGPWRPGRDGEVAASPVFMKGCVDLGVVTFKTSLLEETGFRFAIDRLRTIPAGQGPPKEMFAGMDSLFYADGAFFERLYKRFKDGGQAANKTRMVRRALFIHQ